MTSDAEEEKIARALANSTHRQEEAGAAKIAGMTAEELTATCKAHLDYLKKLKTGGYDLWSSYKGKFAGWTIDEWIQVDADLAAKPLKTLLVNGGIHFAEDEAQRTHPNYVLAQLHRLRTADDCPVPPGDEIAGPAEWTPGPERRQSGRYDARYDESRRPGRSNEFYDRPIQSIEEHHQPNQSGEHVLSVRPSFKREQSIYPSVAKYAPFQQDLSKAYTNVAKLMTDDTKYSGEGHGDEIAFDIRFEHWLRQCKISGVPREAPGLEGAFPFMLKGEAYDYFQQQREVVQPNVDAFAALIKARFETREMKLNVQAKWNRAGLSDYFKDHQTRLQSFEELYEKLRIWHPYLRDQGDDAMQDKVRFACDSFDYLRVPCQMPHHSSTSLADAIREALTTYDRHNPPKAIGDEIMYGDRRVHTPRDDRSCNREGRNRREKGRRDYPRDGRHSHDGRDRGKWHPGSSSNGNRWTQAQWNEYKYRKANNLCLVCGKSDCRANRHPRKERRWSSAFTIDACAADQLTDTEPEDGEDAPDPPSDHDDEAFMVMATPFHGIDLAYVTRTLAKQSIIHAVTGKTPIAASRSGSDVSLSVNQENPDAASISQGALEISPTPIFSPAAYINTRYDDKTFYGLMADTGNGGHTVGGVRQLRALQRSCPQIPMREGVQYEVQFGIGLGKAVGICHIHTPIGKLDVYIVDADIPFLLGLDDMDHAKVYVNNLTNKLVQVTEAGEAQYPLIRRFGHLWVLWGPFASTLLTETFICDGIPSNWLTETELRRIHRRFGHPSVSRLEAILRRADQDYQHEVLAKIEKYCQHCQKHGRSPHRFRFAIHDDTTFNETILVDIMYLELAGKSCPVLHVVDEGTRYQAAAWLRDVSTKCVWDTLRRIWIDSYVGPPEVIVHDQGTQFMASEFVQLAHDLAIATKPVPVEAHHSIGLVERYHGPLRRAFQILCEEMPGATKDVILQAAVKAINDSAGPDGLTPTLLVYGTYPRIGDTGSGTPTTSQRAKAMRRAMDAVRQVRAKQDIKDAMNTRNGPDVDALFDLPMGSEVLVFREKNGWQGPYTLLDRKGHDIVVQMTSGPVTFRSTSVKPYHREPDIGHRDQPHEDDGDKDAPTGGTHQPRPSIPDFANDRESLPRPQRVRKPTRKAQGLAYLAMIDSQTGECLEAAYLSLRERESDELSKKLREDGIIQDGHKPFELAEKKEFDALITKKTFKPVRKLPRGTRVFDCRFVHDMKTDAAGKPYEKARLVVQGYRDAEKTTVLTQSPTVQRSSQRLTVITSVMLGKIVTLRDITMAYTQASDPPARKIYVRIKGKIYLVMRAHYGVAESGLLWFCDYHNHHVDKLGLRPSAFDPCLLLDDEGNIVALQTDDTLIGGDAAFQAKEESALANRGYQAKAKISLSASQPIEFNGTVLRMTEDGTGTITMTQPKQLERMKQVTYPDPENYISQRARGAYVASLTQPEMAFAFSYAAQVKDPGQKEYDLLNKAIQWQVDHPSRGLTFRKVDPEKAKLFVFVDASFANNPDLTSQLGYLLVIGTETKLSSGGSTTVFGNIAHWSSHKCRRVTRSILAAELYGLVHGFDMGYSVKTTLRQILEKTRPNLPLIVMTDSKSLFDCITTLNTTEEKRLMIDIMGLRESYERREIDEIRWIDGTCNPADALTKHAPCHALADLVSTNTLRLTAKKWITRGTKSAT